MLPAKALLLLERFDGCAEILAERLLAVEGRVDVEVAAGSPCVRELPVHHFLDLAQQRCALDHLRLVLVVERVRRDDGPERPVRGGTNGLETLAI